MRWFLGAVVLVTVFFFTAAALVGWAAYETAWRNPSDSAPAVNFVVTPGESGRTIASALKSDGLIRSVWLFEGYAWLSGSSSKFQAGAHGLEQGMNVASVVAELTSSGSSEDVSITIPEGYTLAQIGQTVHDALGISLADWQAATGVHSPLEGTLPILKDKPDSVDLEGYLFPDTYRFAKDATALDVAKEMVQNLANRMEEHADEIGTVENIHTLLTLASIIEREVRTDADRPIVADIFKKRLDAGMALQADSTVNYITGKTNPSASHADTTIDSPYNTYKYPGLPPGPISNPGVASIVAAAHPTPNDYYYFLTTSDGTVIYAKNYDEQMANKAKYL